MRSLKRTLLLMLMIAFLFTFTQCNDKDNSEKDIGAEGGSFYGNVIKFTMAGLMKGGISDIGGNILGHILDLLGWGDSGDSEEQQTLDEMNGKLDDIINALGEIGQELSDLMKMLGITEEEILANTNDPTEYITKIFTGHQALEQMAAGKNPGDLDQSTIDNFVYKVENVWDIANCINGIYIAIIPQTVVKAPVLNNYTDLLINRMQLGNGNVYTAYTSLELYTSQLVTNQLKGVNLIAETKNIDGDEKSTRIYLNDYYENFLKEEIDRPSNGQSFMYNVYRLALANIDVMPKDGKTFFSDEVVQSLKRAVFYRHSTLYGDQPLGLQVLVITTQDIDDSNTDIIARNLDTGINYFYYPTETVTDVPGRVYDHWTNKYSLKPSTLYNVYLYKASLGSENTPPGRYQMSDYFTYQKGEAVVETYDEDYTLTDSGSLHYGLYIKFVRSEMNRVDPMDTRMWGIAHDLGSHSAITAGDKRHWPLEITGKADGSYGYDGWVQSQRYFYYTGEESATVYVDFSGEFSGHVTSYFNNSTGGSNAHAEAHFGVWDYDASKRVSDLEGRLIYASKNDGNKPFWDFSKGTATFRAQRGHEYRCYFYLYVGGCCSSSTESVIRMDSFDYTKFRFE